MKQPQLFGSDSVIESWRANHSRGKRAVGGCLHLTSNRLVFVPHLFERILGTDTWAIEVTDVGGVGVTDASGGLFDGSLRSRLRIEVNGGPDEHFVVPRPTEVAEAIRRVAV